MFEIRVSENSGDILSISWDGMETNFRGLEKLFFFVMFQRGINNVNSITIEKFVECYTDEVMYDRDYHGSWTNTKLYLIKRKLKELTGEDFSGLLRVKKGEIIVDLEKYNFEVITVKLRDVDLNEQLDKAIKGMTYAQKSALLTFVNELKP